MKKALTILENLPRYKMNEEGLFIATKETEESFLDYNETILALKKAIYDEEKSRLAKEDTRD